MTDRDKPAGADTVHLDSASTIAKVSFSRPPMPMTAEDLYAALHTVLRHEHATELFDALVGDIGEEGVTWSLDILWAVAQLSENHAQRVTDNLGWPRERLESEYRRIYVEGGS